MENVGEAKDDNTAYDIEEITKGQDRHQLVEITPLGEEPEDKTEVTSYSKTTNDDLMIKRMLSFRFKSNQKQICSLWTVNFPQMQYLGITRNIHPLII